MYIHVHTYIHACVHMYICIHTLVEARVANPPVSTSLGLGLQISNVHYRTCFVFLRGEWSWALNLVREACMASSLQTSRPLGRSEYIL